MRACACVCVGGGVVIGGGGDDGGGGGSLKISWCTKPTLLGQEPVHSASAS